MKIGFWFSILLLILFFQHTSIADDRISGLYGNLGGMQGGGFKTTLGYRYEILPLFGLFALTEITGFSYFPGYIIAINPGITLKSNRGGYFGFKYGTYLVDVYGTSGHDNYSSSGSSVYAGIEYDISRDNKLIFESGMHFIYAPYNDPSTFYASVGYAWNAAPNYAQQDTIERMIKGSSR